MNSPFGQGGATVIVSLELTSTPAADPCGRPDSRNWLPILGDECVADESLGLADLLDTSQSSNASKILSMQ